MDSDTAAKFLVYFLTTVLLETPVLLLGLSRRHSWQRRLFAGVWLNACSYPIVFLVLPELINIGEQRGLYLLVAEVFAPVAECALFYSAFWAVPDPKPAATPAATVRLPASVSAETRKDGIGALSSIEVPSPKYRATDPSVSSGGRFDLWRNFAVITLANLISFVPLELIRIYNGWTPTGWILPS